MNPEDERAYREQQVIDKLSQLNTQVQESHKVLLSINEKLAFFVREAGKQA